MLIPRVILAASVAIAVCIVAMFTAGTMLVCAGESAAPRVKPVSEPAPGMFLVARRDLREPYFQRSVVLLLEHDADGSLGLIVNGRSAMRLADALPDLDEDLAGEFPVFLGGPVAMRQLFMLIRDAEPVSHARAVTGNLYFSADRRVLERLLERKITGDSIHLYLGYAGWSAGQLLRELARDSWHLVEGDVQAIFGEDHNGLWGRMIEQLEPMGIEVRRARADALARLSTAGPDGY